MLRAPDSSLIEARIDVRDIQICAQMEQEAFSSGLAELAPGCGFPFTGNGSFHGDRKMCQRPAEASGLSRLGGF